MTTYGSMGHLEAIAARRDAEDEAFRKGQPYNCAICGRRIVKEASADPQGRRPASAGDHDSAEHVRKAYGS